MGAYEYYLSHHGVKGQKWGIRRYQNEDGTLTTEGIKKYGDKKIHNDVTIPRNTIGSDFGMRAFGNWRERRFREKKNQANAASDAKKAEKYQSKLDAQAAANANLEAYRQHSSAAKLVIQNMMLTPIGAHRYRKMRARGNGRLTSFLLTTSVGPMRAVSNKRKYGKFVIHDGI